MYTSLSTYKQLINKLNGNEVFSWDAYTYIASNLSDILATKIEMRQMARGENDIQMSKKHY